MIAMNIKSVYILVFSIVLCFGVKAQQEDMNISFEEFSKQADMNFSSFEDEQNKKMDEIRLRANEEFSKMLGRPWKEFETQKAIETPKRPEPPKPEIKKSEDDGAEVELEFEEIIPLPEKYMMPEPIAPIVKPEQSSASAFDFLYYNTRCTVDLNDDIKFTLTDASERAVAEVWKHLSSYKTDVLIADCLNLRKELNLCDWGYITLIDSLTNKLFSGKTNEAAVLQMYILTQSGYNVRIANSGNKLVILMPAREVLYNYSYIAIDNEKYYVLDNSDNSSYKVFNHAFPEEKIPSVKINYIPKLSNKQTDKKTFVAKKYPQTKVEISVNTTLIDFYNEYPCSDWDNYARASLSDELRQVLYPTLMQQIKGKSQEEAANILINFVQTAFEYKTDDEQFGYERPLFGDETFFYPYSDCEDRSILFSILVQDLLNLDVVLVNYPGHLATAVHFTENITGDYMTIDGKKYLVCDPTYIGASIGDAMPKYKTMSAKIVKIK